MIDYDFNRIILGKETSFNFEIENKNFLYIIFFCIMRKKEEIQFLLYLLFFLCFAIRVEVFIMNTRRFCINISMWKIIVIFILYSYCYLSMLQIIFVFFCILCREIRKISFEFHFVIILLHSIRSCFIKHYY